MLLKRRWPNKIFITLFTRNSKFRLNLTQRVTGSLVTYKSLIILIDWLDDWLLEAVRTNPGYGMATLIYNFWDFWELFLSLQGSSAEFLYMISKAVSTILNFEIKYYNNINSG